MSIAVGAIRSGATEVTINDIPYNVWWSDEADFSSDDHKLTPKRVYLLTLKGPKLEQSLSFYGPSKETCLDHLDRYLARREVLHV